MAWGDIAVAAAVLAVVLLAPTQGAAGWAIYGLWNVVGLVDILLAMADPASTAAWRRSVDS